MKQPSLEKIVENGISFLSEFFPKDTSLYFPLLTTAVVWAIKRAKQWKEKVLSWKVWAEPEPIKTKPDGFILDFFKGHSGLRQSFKGELKKKKLDQLREAFSALYPILGLEDPFLISLFSKDLESRDYKKIVKDFQNRVKKAKQDIEGIEEARLLEGLKAIADEAVGLQLELLSQAKLRKTIAGLVKESLKRK
jgi:hypothetical protein